MSKRLLIGLGIAVLCLRLSAPADASGSRWTVLARKVGQSEENRDRAVRQLRKMPTLTQDLTQALSTRDRPLALEVMSDLDLKTFVPKLLSFAPSDPDGFLTLTINSLMDDSNRMQIVSIYASLMATLRSRSSGAIVAMLEPLGRLGIHLPREQLAALEANASPEVRDALLYYLRIMALRHADRGNSDLVEALLHDPTRQLREHARSVAGELRISNPLVSK